MGRGLGRRVEVGGLRKETSIHFFSQFLHLLFSHFIINFSCIFFLAICFIFFIQPIFYFLTNLCILSSHRLLYFFNIFSHLTLDPLLDHGLLVVVHVPVDGVGVVLAPGDQVSITDGGGVHPDLGASVDRGEVTGAGAGESTPTRDPGPGDAQPVLVTGCRINTADIVLSYLRRARGLAIPRHLPEQRHLAPGVAGERPGAARRLAKPCQGLHGGRSGKKYGEKYRKKIP